MIVIFNTLMEAVEKEQLILLEGGFCRWNLRRDQQVTIYEIISLRPGMGTQMLEMLKRVPGAVSIVAKCPVEYESNAWWAKKGFELQMVKETRTGKKINVWKMWLQKRLI